jgi:hypothetical protein
MYWWQAAASMWSAAGIAKVAFVGVNKDLVLGKVWV